MTKTQNIKENKEQKSKILNSNDLNLFLAPMAGYTDLPFRLLARENGADHTVSEMISAKGLYYGDKKTKDLLKTIPGENPYGVQLFGSEPEILSQAVKILEDYKDELGLTYQFIDLNIGCPAPKIVKNGDGSALLKDLGLLRDNLAALTQTSQVPVSVKTRIGFNENQIDRILPVLNESDVDFITIHGRTRDQFYSGHSDWEAVRFAVENSDKPIVLSGDITSPEKAKEALELGVDGIMIGRAAVENPLIFQQIKEFLSKGYYNELSLDEKKRVPVRHIELFQEYNPESNNIIPLRKQLAAYTKGLPGASKLRTEIFKASEPETIIDLFNSIKS